jgi:hypothetical protein
LKHSASPDFWARYHALPNDVRDLADKNFHLLKTDPSHPSLHFKKLGELWSARVGLHYRAIANPSVEGTLRQSRGAAMAPRPLPLR